MRLFVSIALRPDASFGSRAPVRSRAVAQRSFTSLTNASSVSLLAIVPHENIGYPAMIVAVIDLINAVRLHAKLRHVEYVILIVIFAGYVTQLAVGVTLLARPHDSAMVATIAYLIFASFAFALTRVWVLIQGSFAPESE
ncbi:MAG TPA: hypothetical protein VIJ86_04930 [Acidimicrobiales bacterium]